MEKQVAAELLVGDPFFERPQEINDLISARAYQLFESRGFTHGHDREDWLRAESEILLNVPVYITETETELNIRAEMPGFGEKDLEVRVAAHSLCITGKRHEALEQKEGKTVHSEGRPSHIFHVLDLPSPIDPETVNATLREGILGINLLKAETGKKIPVLTRAAAA